MRGVISPSHEGVVDVAPISTPRYNVWLKLTEAIEVTDPNMTKKRPLVTVTLFDVIRSSSQMFVVVALTAAVYSLKVILYVPSATAASEESVSFAW